MQKEFIGYLADLIGAPVPETVDFESYAKTFGGLEAETLSASIKVRPDKSLKALGYRLKFPSYKEGVVDVLGTMGYGIRRKAA